MCEVSQVSARNCRLWCIQSVCKQRSLLRSFNLPSVATILYHETVAMCQNDTFKYCLCKINSIFKVLSKIVIILWCVNTSFSCNSKLNLLLLLLLLLKCKFTVNSKKNIIVVKYYNWLEYYYFVCGGRECTARIKQKHLFWNVNTSLRNNVK